MSTFLVDRPDKGSFYNLTGTPVCVAMDGNIPVFEIGGQRGKWSGDRATEFVNPPMIGERVRCAINNIGNGTVRAYFIEEGWLGLQVANLENRPEWHIKQNGKDRDFALIFGSETKAPR